MTRSFSVFCINRQKYAGFYAKTSHVPRSLFARRATSHRAADAARYIAWALPTYRRPWHRHGLYRIAARQYIARRKAASPLRHSEACKDRPQGDLSPRGIGRAVYRVDLVHISQGVV